MPEEPCRRRPPPPLPLAFLWRHDRFEKASEPESTIPCFIVACASPESHVVARRATGGFHSLLFSF